jgi:Tfp pilus assembly protein PilX
MTTRLCLRRHNEAGSVLVIAMVSLALLTVLGVAAITTGNLESEISGNEKTYQEAFYSAELGLVGGETIIETLPTRGALQEGTIPGRYASGSLRFNETAFRLEKQGDAPSVWQPLGWDDTDSGKVTAVPDGLKRGAVVPHHAIEAGEFIPDTFAIGIAYGRSGVYRFHVAARGTGSSPAAHALLESIYAKRFD